MAPRKKPKKRKKSKEEKEEEQEKRHLTAAMRLNWELNHRVPQLNPLWKPRMPGVSKYLMVARKKSKKYIPSFCPKCKKVLPGPNRNRHIMRCREPKKRGRPKENMPAGLATLPGVRGDGGQQLVIRRAARERRNRELLAEQLGALDSSRPFM